ncbi:hypothetical protein OEA41_008117 [Lepraria neglecta]|uniref:Uncharacterized protein n=1 Tax=Lepraria neglecta TaxID=209136 RepID=A0AAD9ZEJ0_9LECA|nr:hypothetical protein OEA41_008117 [Lepraria neglecta]
MVDAVNSKISDAIAAAGDQVVFVNYDQYFTMYGGRYCENNIIEPDTSRPSLDDPNTELKRSSPDTSNGTFAGDLNDFVTQTLQNNPDWTYGALGGPSDEAIVIEPSASNSNTEASNGTCLFKGMGDTKDQLGFVQSKLPLTWLRVFHPRPQASALIANYVMFHIQLDQAKVLQASVGPEIASMTQCAVNMGPNSTLVSVPCCEYGSDPNESLIPQNYCQCGDEGASVFSIDTNGGYDYTTNSGPTVTRVTWTAESMTV